MHQAACCKDLQLLLASAPAYNSNRAVRSSGPLDPLRSWTMRSAARQDCARTLLSLKIKLCNGGSDTMGAESCQTRPCNRVVEEINPCNSARGYLKLPPTPSHHRCRKQASDKGHCANSTQSNHYQLKCSRQAKSARLP